MIFLFLLIYLLCMLGLANELKFTKILSFALMFLISLLFITNRQNHDYNSYLIIFENPELYVEAGYAFLVTIVKFFGGEHQVILFFLGLLVLYTFFRLSKYLNSKYLSLALLLYFIFPMAIDIVQIRNAFAMFLFINSIISLFENNTKKSFCWVAFAPTFHLFGFVYCLIWFFIQFRSRKHYKKIIVFISIGSFVFVPFFLSYINSLNGLRSLSSYLVFEPKYHSLMFWGAPFLSEIFVLLYFSMTMKKAATDSALYIFNILFSSLLTFMIFLVFVLYLDEFNRLLRTAMVLNYVAVAVMLPFLSENRRAFLLLYILIMIFAYGSYYAYGLDYDYVLFGF